MMSMLNLSTWILFALTVMMGMTADGRKVPSSRWNQRNAPIGIARRRSLDVVAGPWSLWQSIVPNATELGCYDGCGQFGDFEVSTYNQKVLLISSVGYRYSNGVQTGAAFLYRRYDTDDPFVHESTFVIPQLDTSKTTFASSNAICGSTAVVGASGDEGNGRAFVFRKTSSGSKFPTDVLTPDDYLILSGDPHGVLFATSVATNRDSVVVGEPLDNRHYRGSYGRAYVYNASSVGGDRLQTLEIEDSGVVADTKSQFGSCVAMSCDDNLLLVTAPSFGPTGTALVYTSDDGWNWKFETLLEFPGDENAGPYLGLGSGHDCAIDGSYAVIGAPWENNDVGKAYVFRRGTNDQWDTGEVLAEGSFEGQRLGYHVAISKRIAAVADYSGNVFVFRVTDRIWEEEQVISVGGPGSRTVAVYDDMLATGGFTPSYSNYAVLVYERAASETPHGNPLTSVCKGPTLGDKSQLEAGEAICAEVNGEMVYYGVRIYPDDNFYQLEMWSEYGTYNRAFAGLYTDGDPPDLRFQGDAHLLVAGTISATDECRAKPNKRGSASKVTIGGPLPDLLEVRDNDGDLIWKLSYWGSTGGDTALISGSTNCYPEIGPECVSCLREGTILTWDQYVCEYNSSGDVVTRFGLDQYGVLGLWRNDELAWKSMAGDYPQDLYEMHVDWLNLQTDAQLTSYKGEPPKQYKFVSNCCSDEETKITVTDGDVLQFKADGSTIWALAGGRDDLRPRCFSDKRC